MTINTKEDLTIDKLHLIWVNLNMKNERTFEITCTRKLLGGMGMARSYSTQHEVKTVLLTFGFDEALVADRLRELQEINTRAISPYELIEVGERKIPNSVLLASGFIAV